MAGTAELLEKLSDIQKGLEALNDTAAAPSVDPAKLAGIDSGTVDAGDVHIKQIELRNRFKGMAPEAIREMLAIQADRQVGKQAEADLLNRVAATNPAVRKLLDTSGGAALIRQDLEPMLYALFVKRFPLWERIHKEPSNGLVHAFNQITSYGAAQFMSETGTVQDSGSTYVQKTTPIAILSSRRGVTLKEQFAVQAGGMSYNALGTELANGVTAITSTLQKTLVQGNATTGAKTAADEEGLYDQYAFTGLRLLTGTPNSAATPIVLDKGSQSYLSCFNQVVGTSLDRGGNPSAIVMSPTRFADWQNEQLSLIRTAPGAAGVAGLNFGSVLTAAGELPIITVPGGAFGTYTLSTSGREDIYVLDEDSLSFPWLGTDSITTIEIPVGVSGSLNRLFIMFIMVGFAMKAVLFQAKVRI